MLSCPAHEVQEFDQNHLSRDYLAWAQTFCGCDCTIVELVVRILYGDPVSGVCEDFPHQLSSFGRPYK